MKFGGIDHDRRASRPMTSVTLFGGVARIGGNCVLLEDADSSLLVDLGKDFYEYQRYFEFPFKLPSKSVERELLKTGVLPRIRSQRHGELPVYVDFDGTAKEPKVETPLKDVILSHSHADHSGFLSILRHDIRIHLGGLTRVIYSATMESKRESSLETKLYWSNDEQRLTFRDFHSGSVFRVGQIEVEAHAVDHSIPGAYGFIFNTNSGRVGYTGDLRMHGPASNLTERFVQRLEKEPLDLLLCEGTNMNVGRTGSEKQLEADAVGLISRGFHRGNKLVIAEVRSTDIDRMNAFHRVAGKLDCDFFVTRRVAYLLHRIRRSGLAKRLWFGLPDLTKDAKVITSARRRPQSWEKEVLTSPGVETVEEDVIRRPGRRTMVLDSGRFDIFELTPPPGSLYIESVSEHVSEEEEFGEERFLNGLALHGIVVYRLHSSGHAGPEDLVNMILRAKPKKLVPIHTEHPEAFRELFKGMCDVVLPEKGVPIFV